VRADRYLMYRQTRIKFTNEQKARLEQLKNKERKNNGMWYAPAGTRRN
jgi:hypothetical protein